MVLFVFIGLYLAVFWHGNWPPFQPFTFHLGQAKPCNFGDIIFTSNPNALAVLEVVNVDQQMFERMIGAFNLVFPISSPVSPIATSIFPLTLFEDHPNAPERMKWYRRKIKDFDI